MGGPTVDAHTEADREFHEATAHLYDSTLMPIFGVYYSTAIGPLLDELGDRAPGDRALDIGCGTGGITIELAKRGFSVRGVDHSPAMMDLAREKIAKAVPNADVELAVGDVRALPFEDASFDALTCQGVLHHLEDIPATLREFARVLVPGGRFYIAEPCLGSNMALRAWQRGRELVLRRASPSEGEAEIPDHDEAPIDHLGLLAAADEAGLDAQAEYWSQFEGMERLPRPIHAAVLRVLTRPWRHRSGNMVYVTGARR